MRTERLESRLTEAERSLDQAAASAVGERLSNFFRRAARTRAADVLADPRRIAPTDEQAIRFSTPSIRSVQAPSTVCASFAPERERAVRAYRALRSLPPRRL
jgi:uncharacterized protein (DUF1778 family)